MTKLLKILTALLAIIYIVALAVMTPIILVLLPLIAVLMNETSLIKELLKDLYVTTPIAALTGNID